MVHRNLANCAKGEQGPRALSLGPPRVIRFGAAPCVPEQAPSTVIAAIGSDASPGADFLASALTGCWSAKGLRVVPVETDTIPRGASSYRLSLLRVEAVPGSR